MPHVIEIVIEPKLASDLGRLLAALEGLTRDKVSLDFSHDAQSGQIILKGDSEQTLDKAVTVLQRDGRIGLAMSAPQVAYRETLLRRVEIDETHKKQAGGAGQFANVKIVFEPRAGSTFESKIVGGAVPKEYISGIEKGIALAMGCGVLAGFPVIDVRATLIDGAFHDVDSSVLAFEIVSRAAFRRALKEGGSVLLEPIMKVEIMAPEDYTGFVVGDLCARRGQVQGQDTRGNAIVINATVPLANMFGYVNQLRAGTQGLGSYSMRFSHYAPSPPPLPPNGDGPSAPAIALRA